MKRRKAPTREISADATAPSGRHPEHQRLIDQLAQAWPDAANLDVDIDLGDFIHYLEERRIEPAAFFRQVFPSTESRADLLAWRLRGLAGSRYSTLRSDLLGRPHAPDEALYARLRDLMAPLESLEKEDPRRAVLAIRRQLARATDARLRGHWLALLAVALKGARRVGEGAACALVALDLAAETASPLLKVDARIAAVAALVGGTEADDFLAAEVLLEALVDAQLSESRDAVGRVLFCRGLCLARVGMHEDTLQHLTRAAELLESRLWKLGALHSAELAALELGDRAAAIALRAEASLLEDAKEAVAEAPRPRP